MALRYRVSASTGTYTDKDGNEKKRYCDMGVVLDTANGGLMIKLEAIPVGWDGVAWLNDPKPREERSGGGGKQEPRDSFDDGSDIPFFNLTPARCFDVAIG